MRLGCWAGTKSAMVMVLALSAGDPDLTPCTPTPSPQFGALMLNLHS